MWVLFVLLLVLMWMNPPMHMDMWSKTIILCAIIVLTYAHVLLGVIAAGMFMYKLTYRETFAKQHKPKGTKKELFGVQESLRSKPSNSL